MGKQRNQTNQISKACFCLLLALVLSVSGCTTKELNNPDLLILKEWVKKVETGEGKKKYPLDSLVVISTPLTVSFPDIEAYRGSIVSKEKQWEGIFFINKKDKSVEFYDASIQPPEG